MSDGFEIFDVQDYDTVQDNEKKVPGWKTDRNSLYKLTVIVLLALIFVSNVVLIYLNVKQDSSRDEIVVEPADNIEELFVSAEESPSKAADAVTATALSDESTTVGQTAVVTAQENNTSGTTVTESRNTGKININTASVDELMSLNGIGEVKAKAIVDYRNENGSFSSIEEITLVSGIGEKSFEKIKDSITVG